MTTSNTLCLVDPGLRLVAGARAAAVLAAEIAIVILQLLVVAGHARPWLWRACAPR